jgi:hypothetical protein
MRLTITVTLTTLIMMSAAQADAPQGSSGAGQQQGPPREAIAACANSSSGAQCSFTNDRGSVSGTCWAPEGKPLACKPAGNPPSGSTPPKNP